VPYELVAEDERWTRRGSGPASRDRVIRPAGRPADRCRRARLLALASLKQTAMFYDGSWSVGWPGRYA
jgi:hypothetical protein